MSPAQESAVLIEIQGLRADIRVLKTKLLGDDEAENPAGRIPMIEKQVEAHAEDIEKLKKLRERGKGAGMLAGWIATAILAIADLVLYFKELRH